jgi:hypothetical protein
MSELGRQTIFSQQVHVKKETTTGTQIKPASDGTDAIILTDLEINQATGSTPSDEIRNSQNIKDQVQNQPKAGDFSAGMYFRPQGVNTSTKIIDGLMGDPLLESLMGIKLAFTALIDGVIATSTTTIDFTALNLTASEDIPQRGTITVAVGGTTEMILYNGVTITGVSGAYAGSFNNCTRDYALDAATITAGGETITGSSPIYKQSLTRPSNSFYRKNDGTGKQGRGLVLEGATIDVNVDGYVQLALTGKNMGTGVTGIGSLSADANAVADIVLQSGEAKKFSVGSLIFNETQPAKINYLVLAVDLTTDTLTLDSAVTTWTTSDVVKAYLPVDDVSAFLDALHSKDTVVYFDGVSKKVKDTTINISAPVIMNEDEISPDPISAYVTDRRDINLSLNVHLKNSELDFYSNSINDVKQKIEFRFGDGTAGKTVWVIFPVCAIDAPVETTDQPSYNLAITATALDTVREDSCFIVVV